jgi:ubiquinone/menaquinone biosynthesis C-methylase UbiE
MTWEEVIIYVRSLPEYKELVEKSYFDEDLQLNVERFRKSEEFEETLKILGEFGFGRSAKMLEIGAGNGVASISFAMEGFNVTAVEPDLSNTIGNGAIEILKNKNDLRNINIISSFGESIPIEKEAFDIVYVRQTLHHAHCLNDFLIEISRLLKKNGIMLAFREHVIFNKKDKILFLSQHPLQKFYEGENAFTLNEYKYAIKNAGLTLIKTLKYFDSVINFFPFTRHEVSEKRTKRESIVNHVLKKYHISKILFAKSVVSYLFDLRFGKIYSEKKIHGRMYSFIAVKK